jgi:3-phosphoshikimate 1-carboxyvinyltransferase
MVSDFGGRIDADERSFSIEPKPLGARTYGVEPDASSASYPFAIAAATGASITVPGLGAGALQGDYAFTRVLELTGASVTTDASGTTVRAGDRLRGVDVDMHDISDTVMTLAALAPLADGPTRIRNVANIRLKETDRLAAIATELERLGQGVTTTEDSITIEPRPLRPAEIHCYDDHRIAMSFAVLGAATGAVRIQDPACVGKTYPGFWQDLRELYLAAGAEAPW